MVHINEHHAELYVEALSVQKLETKQLEERILLTAMVPTLALVNSQCAIH